MFRHFLNILDPVPGIRQIYGSRDLLKRLVRRNVASKYQGAFLGGIWNFIQPLMMLVIYTYVFSVIFKARWGIGIGPSRGSFAVILFCGMALFSVFSDSVVSASTQIISNPNYVKKVVFPLLLLPLAQVLAVFIQGGVWLLLLLLGAVFIYGNLSFSMLLLPIVVLPLFFNAAGMAFLVSSLSVYIRDTPYVLGVIFQVLFFLTPIFYPVSAVPARFRPLLELNPLTAIIEQTRQVLLFAQIPAWHDVALSWGIGVVVCLLGFAWFNQTQKGFADVI